MKRCSALFFALSVLFINQTAAEDFNGLDIRAFINRRRSEAGLVSCAQDAHARDAAEEYARIIAETGRFSHADASGGDASGRYRKKGGHSLRTGEIIGAGPTIEKILGAWMESARHRSVLLGNDWTHIGTGVAGTQDGITVAVVLFTEKLYRKIEIRDEGNGIKVTGRFTGEGEPGLEINGNLILIEPEMSSPQVFKLQYPREHPVYLLRFGEIKNGSFRASETYIFDPGSS